MKFLFLSSIAVLGAWLTQPALQVEHEPVVTTPNASTATTPSKDDQPAQKPTTKNGGNTMR